MGVMLLLAVQDDGGAGCEVGVGEKAVFHE